MTYMLILISVLMVLTVHRFARAIQLKDDAGRDHCEVCFAVLVVAMTVAVGGA